jgi:predicted permease
MLAHILYRLRALFRKSTVESELNDELQFHAEQHIEKLKRSGLSDEEALREARLRFGALDQVKEECRDARGVALIDALRQDFVYAVRVLRKSPGFTTAVVLSLALGIGANTAMFSLMDAVMWRLLPIHQPEQLLSLTHGQGASFEDGFTYPQYRLMRNGNTVLSDLAAWSSTPLNVAIDGNIEPTIPGQLVSGNYFTTLGVAAVTGRSIDVSDDSRTGQSVAMLSHGYWTRRFGQSPAAVGKTITISGVPFTIIGVTPKEFFGMEVGTSPDIFVPMTNQPVVVPSSENLLDRPGQYLTWIRAAGRLKPGISLAAANAQLEVLFKQEIPKGGKFAPLENERLQLVPAAAGLSDLRNEFSQPLFILMGVVGMVLLIACANTANLLLARAAARQSELAMRIALGAGRGRLISQLLVESLALSSLGGAFGVLLAGWSTKLLVLFLSSGRTPIVLDLNLNLRVLGFALAASMVTGILFGLAPAIRATRNLSSSDRVHQGSTRFGKALAVSQVAFSLVLLIGAGLFARTLQNMNSHDQGFSRDTVLIVRVEPRGSNQRNTPGTSARLDRTYRDLIQTVQGVAGVTSTSMAQFTPSAPRGSNPPLTTPSGEEKRAFLAMIYPGYFATMGIPMLAGRDFTTPDLDPSSPPVAIVNETLAKQVFGSQNAIGKQLAIAGESREIIGVSKDSAYLNPHGDSAPAIFQTFLQTRTGRGQMALYVRTAGDAKSIIPYVRDAVQAVDKQLPVFEVQTLSEQMDAVMMRERMLALLSGLFSTLALILASVGLYGLFAFGVLQRTREIGLRMALGAARTRVVWTVMREVLTLTGTGVLVGILLAMMTVRLASSQINGLLYRMSPSDPQTIAGAIVILTLAAALAGLLPAARASRIDPIAALRKE